MERNTKIYFRVTITIYSTLILSVSNPNRFKNFYCFLFLVGNLKDAGAAVASYLLFYPDDDTMLENKDYYGRLPKANVDLFTPRPVSNYKFDIILLSFIGKSLY